MSCSLCIQSTKVNSLGSVFCLGTGFCFPPPLLYRSSCSENNVPLPTCFFIHWKLGNISVGRTWLLQNVWVSVGKWGTVWDSSGQWGHGGRLMVHEASGKTDVAMPLLPPMFLQLSCNVPWAGAPPIVQCPSYCAADVRLCNILWTRVCGVFLFRRLCGCVCRP